MYFLHIWKNICTHHSNLSKSVVENLMSSLGYSYFITTTHISMEVNQDLYNMEESLNQI